MLTSVALVLKSYFQRVSENNYVPLLSEFVSLNIDFIARSSPKTNEKLNGTWNKRFVTAAEILKIKESILSSRFLGNSR